MEYILIIFILQFIFGQLIQNLNSKPLTLFFDVIAFGLVLLFSIGITYTADWQMYYWFYKIEFDETDYAFYWLSIYFTDHGYSYEDLFRFHIIVISVLNYILIKKFSFNYFYVIITYYVVNYVHAVNQIRYFMGFPLMLLGFHYLIRKNNWLVAIPLFVLSYLCHSALVVLLIFIPIYRIPTKHYIKFIFFGALATTIVIYTVLKLKLGDALDHFGAYFGKEFNSSFMGGLFNALPYLIYYTFLIIESNKLLKNNPHYYEDKNFQFLHKISFFPLVFVFASFFVQILGHRYVLPFVIFWNIYYLYLIKDLSTKRRSMKLALFGIVHIIVVCCFYIFPDFVLKENHYLLELVDMLKSDKILKEIFF